MSALKLLEFQTFDEHWRTALVRDSMSIMATSGDYVVIRDAFVP